jgi:hypothetical protein
MNRSGNLNALTGPEFFRLIAKMGGLWTIGEMQRALGRSARGWPQSPTFPKPAWKVGTTRLWAGWDLWLWLEETNRVEAANVLVLNINTMKTLRHEDLVGR